MSATLKPRYWHSLTAFSLGPGLTEVTVFGGTAEPLIGSVEKQPKLADTTLLQFSECLILCYTYHYSMCVPLWIFCWLYAICGRCGSLNCSFVSTCIHCNPYTTTSYLPLGDYFWQVLKFDDISADLHKNTKFNICKKLGQHHTHNACAHYYL